jgi:hypothetical protein
MKNKILLLFAATFILTGCYERERVCTDFKTGKFKFEHEIDGVKQVTLFERREDIEIDTYEGKTDTSYVRWINDCEYILQKINPKNMQEKKAVHMKILSTTEKTYTFEFSVVGDSNKQKGTVTKLN